MTDHPRDEFRAVEPEQYRHARLSRYIFNQPMLKRRVELALAALQDALFIWNRVNGRPFFLFSPVIDQAKLNNCRVYNHRSTLLRALDPAAHTLEIGVLQGVFSREIIDALKPSAHTMVDINTDQIDRSLFEGIAVDIDIRKGRSVDVLPALPDQSFDYIYIDAGHNEADVRFDLEQSARLIREDGTIMLNDYCNWSPNQAVPYGVMAAVNDFLNESAFEMTGIAIDGTGAFDVTLRRPG